MTADTYKLPETWPEMTALKVRMQRDLLSRAIRESKHPSDAAVALGMQRQHLWSACARLGVDYKTGEIKA